MHSASVATLFQVTTSAETGFLPLGADVEPWLLTALPLPERLAFARPRSRPGLGSSSSVDCCNSTENGASYNRCSELPGDRCIDCEVQDRIGVRRVVLAVEAIHPVVERVVEAGGGVAAASAALHVEDAHRGLVPGRPPSLGEPVAEVEILHVHP